MNNHFYFDTIAANLRSTANFRRRKGVLYPDDKRNILAAGTLDKLAAATFTDVAPEAWAALQPHLDSEYFPEALSEATKSVGFRSHPKNISELVLLVSTFADGFALPASVGGTR